LEHGAELPKRKEKKILAPPAIIAHQPQVGFQAF